MKFDEGINSSSNSEILLEDLSLSDDYKKLMRRLQNLNGQGHNINILTVSDLMEADLHKISNLPGLGVRYIELFINLQKDLPSILKSQDETIYSSEGMSSKDILTKLFINQALLTKSENKQLEKLKGIYGGHDALINVGMILDLDLSRISRNQGYGALFISTIQGVQNKIRSSISKIPKDDPLYFISHRTLFLSAEKISIDLEEIDRVLIEDIEEYLYSLTDRDFDIAQSRWSYNKPPQTLEEVASRYGCARERIRQVEKQINNNFVRRLRIQPGVLAFNLIEQRSRDLTDLLPELYKCFPNDKALCDFLDICCQLESGSLRKRFLPQVSGKVLDPFFCNNPSPASIELVLNELMSNYGYSDITAPKALRQLEDMGRVTYSDDGISPSGLGKKEAVAHALTFHPSGLPWKDIARIVNHKGYSSSLIDETRLAGGFSDSEYIYLCSRGSYRNLMFLDIDRLDVSEILRNLYEHIIKNELTCIHLHDYYNQTGLISQVEYFTLRHIVREYCEEYGVYFNGRNNCDTVSLTSDASPFSQRDVILRTLKEAKCALTKQEIAEHLRSKSINHASLYLHKLMEEGLVVKVDNMVYTTPALAFDAIDKNSILNVIMVVLDSSTRIVEADVFRQRVNSELNLSYSKFFYSALVRSNINALGWYRAGNLFSKSPIPYPSLMSICMDICRPELTPEQNLSLINNAVWLTDSVATSVLRQWRYQLDNSHTLI